MYLTHCYSTFLDTIDLSIDKERKRICPYFSSFMLRELDLSLKGRKKKEINIFFFIK